MIFDLVKQGLKFSTRIKYFNSKNNLGVNKSKDEVIYEVLDLLKPIDDSLFNQIKEAVFYRERIRSTGYERGVAIPHGLIDYVTTEIALGIYIDGVEFNSLDQKPSKFILLVTSNRENNSNYMHIMSAFLHLLTREDIQEEILRSNCPELVRTLIFRELSAI